MLGRRTTPWMLAALVFAGGPGLRPLFSQTPLPDINPPPNQTGENPGQTENYEALTRGPVHEAFANPYAGQPEAGLIVEKKPPELIEEIPPESAPTGENVQWIPGYWGWEPAEENFLWVSGLWRNMPPERRWVPGYWTEMSQGYQWVSGFWSSAQERELSYLPTPPETLERGPNVAAPDGDYFWSPGCWLWDENDYQWRPGYWTEAQEGWIWAPDHYTWTPYGVVFVNGYWDRDFTHRGTLFSPVRFTRIDPGFQYVPRVTIDPSILLLHLFVNRPYRHYRFGDYYAVNDARFGILPWVAYDRQPNVYDPLFTYYQWNYGRRGVNLTERLTSWNQYFVQNEQYRPAATFNAQRQFATRFRGQDNVPIAQTVFAQPFQDVLNADEGRDRFRRVPDTMRKEIAQNLAQFQSIATQRAELEVVPIGRESQFPTSDPIGRRGRLAKTLNLPQTITVLRPAIPTEQPQTTDPRNPQRPEQPGANRPELVPPPARPLQDRQPGTRPDQPGARPDQPGARPDQPGQPGTRPDQPGTRPDQPGTRPDQPGTRPDQPGTRPKPGQPGARGDNPGQRIPPFNYRRPDERQPRGQTAGQPGQNPQQIDPRNRGGFDSLPPGSRRLEANPGQPSAQPQGQERRDNPGQGIPPRGNPGKAGPAPGGPAPGGPAPGGPAPGGPAPGGPGQAGPTPGNPGPGPIGPPQQGGKPPRRGKSK